MSGAYTYSQCSSAYFIFLNDLYIVCRSCDFAATSAERDHLPVLTTSHYHWQTEFCIFNLVRWWKGCARTCMILVALACGFRIGWQLPNLFQLQTLCHYFAEALTLCAKLVAKFFKKQTRFLSPGSILSNHIKQFVSVLPNSIPLTFSLHGVVCTNLSSLCSCRCSKIQSRDSRVYLE